MPGTYHQPDTRQRDGHAGETEGASARTHGWTCHVCDHHNAPTDVRCDHCHAIRACPECNADTATGITWVSAHRVIADAPVDRNQYVLACPACEYVAFDDRR